MFNLFRSRDKAVRYLLSALLLLVAASMVTYLIPGGPGYFGAASSDTVVAVVGDQKVTLREVHQAINMTQRGRNVPSGMMQYLVPQLIDQLITERAVEYQAGRMGFAVSDADTAAAIRQQLPQLFEGGKFVGNQVYAAVLAQQNLSIQEFENTIARQILLNRLRTVVLEGLVVSGAEVEAEYKRRNDKSSIEYVKIDPAALRAQVQVTPQEIREYFDKNAATFRIEEKRSLLLVVFDPALIEASLVISDDEVRRAYEQNKDRYRIPERVRARHILLNTVDKPKEEVGKIQAKAEALLKQLKSGADFAELAKRNSDDPGSKDKGGDLDYFERGRMVPEFEAAAFSLKPKEISNLIKTQYGFHILQVLDKQEARLKPFDEVKAELASELKKERASLRSQAVLDEALVALKRNPQQAEEIARKFGLLAVPVEKAGSGDPIPHLGVNRDFQDAVALLRKGEVSPPVQAPGNKTVIAVVRDVFPARQASFEEVRDQIRSSLETGKANELTVKRANELLEKVKSLNGDLKKAAKSMGFEVVVSKEFTRHGAIAGLGAADGVPEAFTRPAGTVFGPVVMGTSRIVGKVSGHTPANLAELPAQKDAIRNEIRSNRARERNTLFEDGIRRQLEKEGKLKVHQEVVQRLIANYRG